MNGDRENVRTLIRTRERMNNRRVKSRLHEAEEAGDGVASPTSERETTKGREKRTPFSLFLFLRHALHVTRNRMITVS